MSTGPVSRTAKITDAQRAAAPATSDLVRPAQTAKFISADAGARKLDLGADGKLPALKLEETAGTPVEEAGEAGSNPWLLIGVLGFSIVTSIAMLLIDASPRRGEREAKVDARLEILRQYVEPPNPRATRPYQQRLRQALQAHSRGDDEAERMHYRAVSDMLRAGDLHPLRGLTGEIDSDDRLKELLTILLRD